MYSNIIFLCNFIFINLKVYYRNTDKKLQNNFNIMKF